MYLPNHLQILSRNLQKYSFLYGEEKNYDNVTTAHKFTKKKVVFYKGKIYKGP